MRFKDRNFPYPVLDPAGRDIANSAFQVTRTVKVDKTALYLHVEFDLSNETLVQLIKDGKAAFVVHADCANSFYRKAFLFNEFEGDISIPMTDVKREVGLAFFVCATEPIDDYSVKGMDELYGDTTFRVIKGDVLAYAETVTENIFDKDSLSKLASILLVLAGNEGQTVSYIDFNHEKIHAVMPPAQFELFGLNKSRPQVKATLLAAVVLPVLIEAVQKVLEGDEDEQDESDYASYLWFQVLKHKIGDLRKKAGDNSQSPYSLAQLILEGVSDKALREVDNLLNP